MFWAGLSGGGIGGGPQTKRVTIGGQHTKANGMEHVSRVSNSSFESSGEPVFFGKNAGKTRGMNPETLR